MTMIYVHPVMYRCNGRRCKAESYQSFVRVPEGWTERTSHPDGYVEHFCPKCTPPEEKR